MVLLDCCLAASMGSPVAPDLCKPSLWLVDHGVCLVSSPPVEVSISSIRIQKPLPSLDISFLLCPVILASDPLATSVEDLEGNYRTHAPFSRVFLKETGFSVRRFQVSEPFGPRELMRS